MPIPTLSDNSSAILPDDLTDIERSVLEEIGNRPLGKLVDAHPELLVFPRCLGDNRDDINCLPVFSFYEQTLETGNVVGFCGKHGVNVHIHSRFDSDGKQYFLHYMLQKVFGINMLDLPTTTEGESIWDFLPYLFPFCLKKAMRQGLFRTYRTFRYNNDKVKGTIDIPAHIQQNIPFVGKVAYRTREHTANNHLIHLVRHTIEAIRRHPLAGQLLTNDQETRQYVETITIATPDYNPHELDRVMQRNLRPVRHPFYTEYAPLQQLCMKILRYERLTYGEDEDEIHGILFDASWLWEEYLAKVLCPIGFLHPQNKSGIGALDFYTGEDGSYKGAFPDFYCDELKAVIDAKYKPLEGRLRSTYLREDRFQLISYMHIQTAEIGLLMFPTSSKSQQPQWEGTLRGFGGKVGIYGFGIPDGSKHFAEFSDEMDSTGDSIAHWLQNYVQPSVLRDKSWRGGSLYRMT